MNIIQTYTHAHTFTLVRNTHTVLEPRSWHDDRVYAKLDPRRTLRDPSHVTIARLAIPMLHFSGIIENANFLLQIQTDRQHVAEAWQTES